MRPALRRLASAAAMAGLYLGLTGSLAAPDIAAAALAAAAVAGFTFWLRGPGGDVLAPRADLLRLSGRVARHAALDCLIVARALTTALARRDALTGTVRDLAWTPRGTDSPALRAFVAIGLSLAPNSYVIDAGAGENRLLVHHLVPPPPSSKEIWLP